MDSGAARGGAGRRVVMVTGATGSIGGAIAKLIAAEAGTEVVLACRNEAKAKKSVQAVRQGTGNEHVRFEIVDIGRRESVEALAHRWRGPLHTLVNNAAIAPRQRCETPEGLEVQFATNIMGYFWMTEALTEALRRAAPARVVNVASYWAGGLDLDDLQFRKRPYDNDSAYRQSKQANRMLAVAFAERLQPEGIAVNACHPGDVRSTLSTDLGFGGHETPEQGAATPVWLATSSVGQQTTGKYFEHMRESRCRFGEDVRAVQALYEICAQLGGGHGRRNIASATC